MGSPAIGEVVLVPLPFSDLTQSKICPAVRTRRPDLAPLQAGRCVRLLGAVQDCLAARHQRMRGQSVGPSFF